MVNGSIERAETAHGGGELMVDKGGLESVIGSIRSLPALPMNIRHINDLIDRHHSTAEVIGREILKDQALSAQILKLVNSGFYGFSNNVSSVPHAVVLLGLNVVRDVVNGSWAAGMISDAFPDLYRHSIACARACFLLSRNLGVDDPQEVSTLGLLHDIGKVILSRHLPDKFDRVRSVVAGRNARFVDAEMEALGVTHAGIGGWLLKKWNLPDSVVGPVAAHHSFDPDAEHARRAAILILADVMVRAEGWGWAGDWRMPELDEAVPEMLKLDIGDLRELMDEMTDQMFDIERYMGADNDSGT